MSLGLDFSTVRVLCHACGWFRNLGYTGVKGSVRSVIKVLRSNDPSHVLRAKVLEFPANKSLEEIASLHPDYQDLEVEAHEKGLFAMLDEFRPLLEGASCPRCKETHDLCVDATTYHGMEQRF